MKKLYLLPLLFSLGMGMNNTQVIANDRDEIQNILYMKEAPDGVVFEVLAGKDGLNWAIPRIRDYSARLREKFPQLSIAVVSHGREMFALTRNQSGQKAELHKQVKSLVQDNKVQLHVCGTYAEWKGVSPEEFVDFVDVAAEGPAQIHMYEDLGFLLVKLTPPKK